MPATTPVPAAAAEARPEPTQVPEISVVIPVRNSERYLEELLEALDRQTLPAERFEVLVVDDASVDSSRAIVGEWCARAPERRQLLSGQGRGPGAARNVGIDAARGKWIAFTDSDTIPDRNWLRAALTALKTTGARAIEGAIEPWPPEAVGPYTHQVSTDSPGRFMTANMVYERLLLESLRGFDERFRQAFLEDSDLAFRALDAGVKIPFARDAKVNHRVILCDVRSTLRETRKHRWLALLASKHPARYQDQMRETLPPLTNVDIEALIGLAASCALPGSSGRPRVVLTLIAANAFRRSMIAAEVLSGPRSEALGRGFLAFGVPICKTWWWLHGCIRFRKLVR